MRICAHAAHARVAFADAVCATVLVGDTSSSTLLSAYPQIAEQFPDQIACIFIRNTSATDPDDKIPFSTSEFKNINNNTWFFYRTADGTSSPLSYSSCLASHGSRTLTRALRWQTCST